MSDKLKSFIEQNEAHFDSVPKPGHFDRFRAKQNAQLENSRKKTNINNVLFKVAAVAVLFLGISWVFFNLGKMQGANEIASTADSGIINNTELAQAEVFFSHQIDTKKEEVLNYSGSNNEATQQILRELEKLELQYIDLKEELAFNGDNPQIINAMVENYRVRLSLLERLLEQLKKSTTIKKQQHENIQA